MVGHTHAPQQLVDALPGQRAGHMVERREELEVLATSQPPVERTLFAAHQANPLAHLAGLPHDIVAGHMGLAGARDQRGAEHLDQRGFPSAVLAQQPKQLTAGDLERHLVNRQMIGFAPGVEHQVAVGVELTKALGQRVRFNRGLHSFRTFAA